jgi:hypothetical protein
MKDVPAEKKQKEKINDDIWNQANPPLIIPSRLRKKNSTEQ